MKKQEEILTNNIFNLEYKTYSFENQYQEELITKLSSSNTTLFKLNLIFIIPLIIFIFIYFKCQTRLETFAAFIPLIAIILLRTLDKAYPNNKSIQATIGVLYYSLYSLFLIVVRKALIGLCTINALLLVSLYYFDITSKLIIICSQVIDHNKFCKANLGIFIVTQFLHFKSKPSIDSIAHWLFESVLISIEILFSYWIIKRARYVYYCIDKVYIYHNWFRDLLNNINTSFLKVRNGDVLFINKHFIQVLNQFGAVRKEDMDDMPSLRKQSDQILKAMFTTIVFSKEIADNETKAQEMEGNFSQFKDGLLQKIKKIILSNKGNTDLVIFIGYFNLEENTSSLNYAFECYCRFDTCEFGEGFEFIFNNVTRTKILEEKNAEFRIKTTFLSKVVHEFKNPLICLSEMIDEEVNSKRSSKENCLTIKSISNYLLILIKNIDLFSHMQFQPNSQSENQCVNKRENSNELNMLQCCLNGIFEFISLISDYLIRKKKAEMLLKFTIINKTTCLYIKTDEVKLKQLLINLISNAIKFTYKGAITLTISEREQSIRFSVKDTGIGIPDSIRDELFNPFSKAKKNNDPNNMLGTGLGLSISKELANSLGTGFNFESVVGQGTNFWFDIPYNNLEDEETLSQISLSSLLTLKDEFISPFSAETKCSSHQLLTLLIADDDSILRNSSIKLLKRFADLANITLEIIEACDGLELLWKYYENTMKNKSINIILSDEDMFFYSGNKAAQELNTLCSIIGSKPPKFYILSSNEFSIPLSKYINGYYKKPLIEENLPEIFSMENLSME